MQTAERDSLLRAPVVIYTTHIIVAKQNLFYNIPLFQLKKKMNYIWNKNKQKLHLLHIDGLPCRGLHIAHPVGPRQLLRLLLSHLTLGFQVTLVADQQEDDAVRLDVALRLLQPVVDVLKGAAVCDVKEQEATH